MQKIKSYARFLEFFCLFIGVPLISLAFLYKWFGGTMPVYNDIAACSKKVTLYTGLSYIYNAHSATAMTIISRFLGAFIDGISIMLLLWCALCFIKFLKYYQRGELFTANTLGLFNKMSKIIFAWAVYEPFKFTLLSIVTTLSNQAGQRVIALGFTSNDVINIFVVGFFLIITSLMHEAYELKSENDLTI
jgi:hypothetical protein